MTEVPERTRSVEIPARLVDAYAAWAADVARAHPEREPETGEDVIVRALETLDSARGGDPAALAFLRVFEAACSAREAQGDEGGSDGE